jgi:hypothetical protein
MTCLGHAWVVHGSIATGHAAHHGSNMHRSWQANCERNRNPLWRWQLARKLDWATAGIQICLKASAWICSACALVESLLQSAVADCG